MNLGIAIALVAEGFKNKTDKAGEPYILHCLRVMYAVPDEDKIPAVLHDYVEDLFPDNHEEGFDFLRKQGFHSDDITIIRLLTHEKGEDYLGIYIKRIAMRERAIRIKKSNFSLENLK